MNNNRFVRPGRHLLDAQVNDWSETAQIRGELNQAEQRLDTGRAIFHRALELLDNPQAMYRRGSKTVKTTLNKAFFTKLYVDGPQGHRA